jgi:hypothetical protein
LTESAENSENLASLSQIAAPFSADSLFRRLPGRERIKESQENKKRKKKKKRKKQVSNVKKPYQGNDKAPRTVLPPSYSAT